MEKAARGSDSSRPEQQNRNENNPSSPGIKPSRKRFAVIGIVATLLFVVIALGLGLGLGLGLKHHGDNVNASNSTSPPSSSSAPAAEPSWRRNTSEYELDMTTWDLNAPPTTRHFDFTLSQIQGFPDGVERTLYVINGQFPGPLVRVNRGDRVVVNVTNELPLNTTLHWHGLYQNGTNWMDGTLGITQCPIPPGKNFVYNFTVQNQFGTYWYHSHVQTQYMDGLFGPLIIHAPEEAQYRHLYDSDQVVLLTDYYHNLSATYIPDYLASGNENAEPVPDNGLINGMNFFNCSSLSPSDGYTCFQNSSRALFNVDRDKRYRLRLINAGGFAMMQFSVDNHSLSVIESDSTMVQPVSVDRLYMAVAERYSVVLTANQTAENYWLRSALHEYCFAASNPVLDAQGVRAILSYTNNATDPSDETSVAWGGDDNVLCQDLNTTLLVPTVVQQAPKADLFYSLQFSFEIFGQALDRAYINGTTWIPSDLPTLNAILPALKAGNATYNHTGQAPSYEGLSNQLIIDLPDYAVVDILLTNFDDASHPFHLHGHTFWVMASSPDQYFDYGTYGSLNTTNPLRKDTVIVDSFGWVLIRFINDNPGLWAFHCHIAWHLEAGLMMQFQARNDIMRDWTIPSDVLDLCNAS